MEAERECSFCKATLPPAAFHSQKVRQCRTCKNTKLRALYKLAPERRRAKRIEQRNRTLLHPERYAAMMFSFKKSFCKRHGIPFSLDRADIIGRMGNLRCERTGLPLTISRGTNRYALPWSPSLDRIDPSKGYTKENTMVVAFIYNVAKNQWGDGPVMELAKALVGVTS